MRGLILAAAITTGAFAQSYPSLEEALSTITRIARWSIAESDVNATDRYYVDFQFFLDSSQLPPPMRLDLNAQSEWKLGVERTVPVE